MSTAIDFSALHQYSDDSEIVSLVRSYAEYVGPDGIIHGPGKFESEPIHTVYYWGWLLQGEGDSSFAACEHADSEAAEECDCEPEIDFTTFDVSAGDEEAFPLTLAGLASESKGTLATTVRGIVTHESGKRHWSSQNCEEC